jgi:hypothetical protein
MNTDESELENLRQEVAELRLAMASIRTALGMSYRAGDYEEIARRVLELAQRGSFSDDDTPLPETP